MAGNIKTFESPIDKLAPTEVGAEAYEMMGRHVEATYRSAGQDIGGAVAGVGQQLEEHDTTMQTADLMKNMSELEIQAHQSMISSKTNMNINDPDAVNKFMDGFQDQVNAITSKTYTSKAYDAMTRMMSDFNTRTRQNFTGYQAEAQSNEALASFNNSTANWANLANQDPNYAGVGVDAVKLAAQNLPAEHRAEYTLQNTQHIMDSSAEGITSRVEGMKVYDPNAVTAAKAYITDPKNGFVDGMSAPKFADIMNRLDNARRNGTNQTIAGATLNAGAMEKQIGQTGIVPPAYTAMIGNLRAMGTSEAVAKANELDQNAQNQQGAYHIGQIVNNVPSSELSGVADQVKNASKNPNLSASQIGILQTGAEKVEPLLKARNEAFYGGNPVRQGQWNIDTNSSIQNAYDAWRKNPTPEAFQAYYEKSLGNQRYLEPGAVPSIMTADIANSGHRVMSDAKINPLQGVQDLKDMATMYGPAWPSIAGDLTKMGIFNGNQLVAASLSGDPAAAGFQEQLIRASVSTPKQLEEYKDISYDKASKLVRPLLDPLVNSMGNVNNKIELTDMYTKAAANLVQSMGEENASKIVNTMYMDRYQFVGHGSTIRLDAGIPDGDAIGAGSRNVLHDIGNHDLVIPSSGRLGSINAKEAWSDALKANGIWHTSPNGNSAILYDGPLGNPVYERNKQGKSVPVELSFAELARLGTGKTVTQNVIEQEESHIK